MANNKATLTIDATILPDQISKTLKDISVEYTPADGTEGWYYSVSNITNTNGNLIEAKTYLQKGSSPTGIDVGSSSTSVAATDKVKFLFIRHLGVTDDGSTANTNDSIYICLDGGTAAHNLADAIEIAPNEVWFGKFNNVTVDDVHVISALKGGAGTSSTKIQCLVAAIIDDV